MAISTQCYYNIVMVNVMIDRYAVSENSTRLSDEWSATYQLIKAANYIINNADKLMSDDERLNKKVNTTKAQAAYWRAYCYFQLSRCWGKVPLVLEDEINYQKELSSEEAIFSQIIEDLKFAETYLPVLWTSEPWVMNGMNVAVSQGAAKATLAYIYLSMAGWPFNKTEYYAMAASKAKEVIDLAFRFFFFPVVSCCPFLLFFLQLCTGGFSSSFVPQTTDLRHISALPGFRRFLLCEGRPAILFNAGPIFGERARKTTDDVRVHISWM